MFVHVRMYVVSQVRINYVTNVLRMNGQSRYTNFEIISNISLGEEKGCEK